MHSKDLNKQLLLGGNDRAETDEPATVDADRPVTCDADKPLRLIDWFWSYSYYYYYYLTARLDCGVLLSQEPFDDTSSVKSSSSSQLVTFITEQRLVLGRRGRPRNILVSLQTD